MAENHILGDLDASGFEVVQRVDRYFVHYDAGAHAHAWREDQITTEQLARMRRGKDEVTRVLFEIQQDLERSGEDPYISNWSR